MKNAEKIIFILSKMMRNDPVDRQDILFILNRSKCSSTDIEQAINQARVPDVLEIREQFDRASRWLMNFFREQENE